MSCAAALSFAVVLTTALRAQEIAATTINDREITSIREFWSLSPQERLQSHRYRIECNVTYFDPIWRNLWVQDRNDEAAYVVMGDRLPQMKSGDRVRVTGIFHPPNDQFTFIDAEFAVLGPATTKILQGTKELWSPKYLNQLVELEAFVVHQQPADTQHLQLALSVAGQALFAWVLVEEDVAVPNLVDSNVRIRAVIGRPPAGGSDPRAVELKIPRLADIEHVSWLSRDPRFELPVTSIETLREIPRDRLVHVVGELQAQELGRSVQIRDATGQVEVLTAQTRALRFGDRVEAIGYPVVDGMQWNLAGGLFRPAGAQVEVAAEEIRVAAGVLELLPEEAATARAVRLTGVVTWSAPDKKFFFLHDTSGGVCVYVGDSGGEAPPLGRHARATGVTGIGTFGPVVKASAIENLGSLALPAARLTSLETALSGAEEAQWVEMRGYLRRYRQEGGKTTLEIMTSTGSFQAEIPGEAVLEAEEGAVVRLRGVCTAVADEQRKLTGIRLLVPTAVHVQVEEKASADVFELPRRRLANLGQFGTLQLFNRRVKLAGVVLHQRPGRFVQLEDGGESVFVETQEDDPLAPGDVIEAVGLLGRQAGRPMLREAVYRRLSRGPAPEPRRLEETALIRPELNGRLVRVEARLLDTSHLGGRLLLAVQARNTIFEAYLDGPTGRQTVWRAGSRLALTGIYEPKYADEGRAALFQIRLRSPADVAVLAPPSPLTRERILTSVVALAAGILMFVAWVVALRRRVRRQTDQIREQMQRERRLEAELERTAKLESLGLLAGGIAHDFNNLLTIVMGNLSLAALDMKPEGEDTRCLREAERAVVRARDLTQQLLTFAKGGAPLRSAVKLGEIVREVALFALRGSKVRCTFQIPSDLWPADVDKGQISQVVQNIVLNALQAMAAGGEIEITMKNGIAGAELQKVLQPGRYVELSVTDHGVGIPPENLIHVFDPYFTTKRDGSGLGLATVHSIVKKHFGHITVESVPGLTTFRIWLPAATKAPRSSTADSAMPPPGKGRVLFMDDDAEIRSLGLALLKRFGYEATAVADGAAAVKEYESAFSSGVRFDLVILDLTVPGAMGGQEAMEQLRTIDPGVRALVSSGYSNDAVLADYRSHGFCGMVSKPYEAANLARTISEVLNAAPAPLMR